jgi:UDP-N-acetylmuramyl pentapeptide phosphotransferase/UDP-N-acetylglucosamine-1-phosphate transferase
MWSALLEWKESILGVLLALGAAALGVLMRYAHEANINRSKIEWSRLLYEIPTIVGMTIVAVPISDYLATNYGVSHGVVAAVCLFSGYIGTRLLDLVADLIDHFAQSRDKTDGKNKDRG